MGEENADAQNAERTTHVCVSRWEQQQTVTPSSQTRGLAAGPSQGKEDSWVCAKTSVMSRTSVSVLHMVRGWTYA